MRIVFQFAPALTGRSAKVYRIPFEGYVVRFFEGGKHLREADYETDTLADATGTACEGCR